MNGECDPGPGVANLQPNHRLFTAARTSEKLDQHHHEEHTVIHGQSAPLEVRVLALNQISKAQLLLRSDTRLLLLHRLLCHLLLLLRLLVESSIVLGNHWSVCGHHLSLSSLWLLSRLNALPRLLLSLAVALVLIPRRCFLFTNILCRRVYGSCCNYACRLDLLVFIFAAHRSVLFPFG